MQTTAQSLACRDGEMRLTPSASDEVQERVAKHVV
jgi:hypothetical protein